MRRKNPTYQIIKPSDKELDFYHSWEIQRMSPKWKFILINGVLKEGMVLFIFFKLLQFIVLSDASRIFYTSATGLCFLFFEVLFWFFAGYVVGWFKFNSNEIEYELIKGIKE